MFLGIVEGFCGPLWDKLDHISMIGFMHHIDMNTYNYAPNGIPIIVEDGKVPIQTTTWTCLLDS